MSFLNALINEVADEDLREQLQERVDIIQHKIKFMDKVSVVCLDTNNMLVGNFRELLEEAGGELQYDATAARVLIYAEQGQSALHLMGAVPALLNEEWPAVEFNRVYLWDTEAAFSTNAEDIVESLEDLAEMLYPGYFVFGNEGDTWISFKTK
ncbi:substrate-binding domain-containing protein [Pedobacter sp. PWIIR3]